MRKYNLSGMKISSRAAFFFGDMENGLSHGVLTRERAADKRGMDGGGLTGCGSVIVWSSGQGLDEILAFFPGLIPVYNLPDRTYNQPTSRACLQTASGRESVLQT